MKIDFMIGRLHLPKRKRSSAPPLRIIAQLLSRLRPRDIKVTMRLGGDIAMGLKCVGALRALGVKSMAVFGADDAGIVIRLSPRVILLLVAIYWQAILSRAKRLFGR